MDININSKINHLSFINCKNITINVNSLVSGIDIKNSEDINIYIKKTDTSNSIVISRSSFININISEKNHKKNIYNIEKSKLIYIKDNNGNIIDFIKKR